MRRSASSAASARWCARTRPSARRSIRRRALAGAPETFKSVDYKSRDLPGMKYTVQVAPEDCTGCALCVEGCPAKNKSEPRFKAINMAPQPPLRFTERDNFAFFLDLPELDRTLIPLNNVKNSQLLQPLFEFSGACSGCGETPYVKLVSQLFGDRAIIANATGCSSIYGGNLPTTPWSVNQGRPRPGLVEQPLRGQRRVRSGLPADHRQTDRVRPRDDPGAPRCAGRRAGGRAARRGSIDREGSRRAARSRGRPQAEARRR